MQRATVLLIDPHPADHLLITEELAEIRGSTVAAFNVCYNGRP